MAGQTFHIIGYGRFGRQAAARLACLPDTEVVVVDADPDRVWPAGARAVVGDGIDHVADLLQERAVERTWIVPTVPFHLASEVLQRLTGRVQGRWRALPDLPGRMVGKTGDVLSSLADFICPADCPGPEDMTCAHTGQRRERHLHEILESLDFQGLPSLVLTSRQLAPGVGGFEARALQDLERRVTGAGKNAVIVSTASCCHGVSSILV